MKKQVILAMMTTSMISSLLAGCSASSGTNATTANIKSDVATTEIITETAKNADDEDFTIGYISPGPDTWYQRAEEGAKWACDKAGVNFVSVNSNRDSEQEQTNIDNLINEGVDAIVILSWNEAGCVSAAEKCQQAGIGCVVFDGCGVMKNHDVDITAAVDFDWPSMGQSYADWMGTTYPGENYVYINGTPDSPVCQTLEKSLKDASGKEGMAQLLDVRYGEYDPETAANTAEDLINSGLDFSVIGVINEDCAAAIITRLQDLGVKDQYHVFAQNGSDTGVQLLKSGDLEFTIASSPGLEGAVAAFAAIDGVKNGKEVNQEIDCPIANVTQSDADDPEKVIPWAVDDSAWAKIIQDNFPDYNYFFE